MLLVTLASVVAVTETWTDFPDTLLCHNLLEQGPELLFSFVWTYGEYDMLALYERTREPLHSVIRLDVDLWLGLDGTETDEGAGGIWVCRLPPPARA